MSTPNLPTRCPSCAGEMEAVTLRCKTCGTEVQGHFAPCRVCRLNSESRELFELFLDSRGNLKEVQRTLGLSYPTVRQRIQEMFRQLGRGDAEGDPAEVLRRLREGEISVDEAEKLLSG